MSITKWAILAFLKTYLTVDLSSFPFHFLHSYAQTIFKLLQSLNDEECLSKEEEPTEGQIDLFWYGLYIQVAQIRLYSAGRRSSCAAGWITVQCCPKWWSWTGTRLMTFVVISWGSSPTPGSAAAPAALHCTRDGTQMPGMELQFQGSAQERSWSSAFQWGNWGMEGLLSPTSTSCHNSCSALFCLSLTAPLQLFLHWNCK